MLFSHFSSVLEKYHNTGKGIVLALSGGVDSRVLLDLLCRYKQQYPENRYTAVHIHHGLSDNADHWAEQCKLWCQEASIPLTIKRVRLIIDAQTSVEQEAREKRYQALSSCLREGDILITGQHLGDQTETFLLALKRGSGPKGLSSMPEAMAFAKGQIVRPLLNFPRESVEKYASEHNLSWVEDESNQDTKFDRNFLRTDIIPRLKSRWPHIEKSIHRSATLCAEQEALLEELLTTRLDMMLSLQEGLSVEQLGQQSEAARNQLIRLWLARQSFLMPSQKQLSMIWSEVACARQDANPKLVLTSGEVRRFQNHLYTTGKYQDISQWHSPVRLNKKQTLPDNLGSIEIRENSKQGNLRSFTESEKLWISFNPQGLKAHPQERAHSRNLKKLFQEYGVPGWLRRRTPILMKDDQVVAIPGLFISKTFSGVDCELIWNKDDNKST